MITYHIDDGAWKKIYEFLKTCPGIYVKQEDETRLFLEAIWYVARSECQWRLLPGIYGRWSAVYKRFRSWINQKILKKLFEYFQVDPDTESVMLDATIVRAHACSAGYMNSTQEQEALGRSRGGFSTKIHALVDGLGYPLQF